MPPKKKSGLTPVGKRIRAFRTKKRMTLDNLANETGFSVDYLKQIESGKIIPPVGALLQLSRALQIDSSVFLQEQATRLTDRIEAYTKRTDNYAYTTLTPGAENKHLKAFRVAIEPKADHKGVGYQHGGEEFVYMLAGMVEIMVGDHGNRLTAGESLHFNSGIPHHMRNLGDDTAELLVVIYGP